MDSDGNLIQPNAQPGDFRFADLNGDGKITDADQTDLGNPYPDFFFGLSTTMEWKGFDLNLFFYGSVGNEIVNATTRYDVRVLIFRLIGLTDGILTILPMKSLGSALPTGMGILDFLITW